MRRYVYETKNKATPGQWSPMLTVEEGFFLGAKKEWLGVRDELRLLDEDTRPVLESVCAEAKSDIASLLNETIPEVEAILKPWDLNLFPVLNP